MSGAQARDFPCKSDFWLAGTDKHSPAALAFPITRDFGAVGDHGDLPYLQSALEIASGTAFLCEAILLRNHSTSELCPLRAQQVMNGRQALPPQSADVLHRIPQPHWQNPNLVAPLVVESGWDATPAVCGTMSSEITVLSERSGIR